MPTINSFDPATLCRVPVDQVEMDIGNARDEAVSAPLVSRAGILMAAVAAIGIAVLAMANAAGLFAERPASLADNAPPPPTPALPAAADAPASAPSTADIQSLPSATVEVPAQDKTAAAEPAGKHPMERSEALSETLFRQFQAWAAEQEAQAPGGSQAAQAEVVPQIMRDAPGPAAGNARGLYRPVQRRRQVRAVNNARAEMRKQVQRAQGERARRPVQDAQAQPGQNAQAPSLLPNFGTR